MTQKSIFAVTLLAAMAGCHHKEKIPDPAPYHIEGQTIIIPSGSPQLASLNVEPVTLMHGTVVHMTGRLVWDEDVTVRVFSPFSGRVRRVLVEIGQSVQRGAPLVEIESPDYGQAQTDARRAETDFQLAERNLSRINDLFEHGAAAHKDIAAAQADYARSASEKERTSARLAALGGRDNIIDQAFILRAPLVGVVAEKNINPGQEIRPDQMLSNAPPLFVITDPTRLWLQLDASERDLAALTPGSMLTVHSQAYPSRLFEGRLNLVTDMLDPQTRTLKVRGTIANPERMLKAEMYVNADLRKNDQDVIQVDKGAVLQRNEKYYLFIEDGPGRFTRKMITIGAENDGHITVIEGLSEGDRVVGEGSLLLEEWLESPEGS